MTEREPAPRDEYRRRESWHQERAADSGRLQERISHARLGVALTAALIAWLAFGVAVLSPWWLVVPVLAFAALVAVHGRVRGRRRQAERRAAFYRRGLARLEGQWTGAGRTGRAFATPIIHARTVSTSSAKARCTSCSATLGPAWARRRLPRGCWRR